MKDKFDTVSEWTPMVVLGLIAFIFQLLLRFQAKEIQFFYIVIWDSFWQFWEFSGGVSGDGTKQLSKSVLLCFSRGYTSTTTCSSSSTTARFRRLEKFGYRARAADSHGGLGALDEGQPSTLPDNKVRLSSHNLHIKTLSILKFLQAMHC